MKGILTGIKHHPWRAFTYFFASFSVLWTLIEGFTYFISSLDLRGPASLITVTMIGIFYAALMIRRPSKIQISIRHTNTKLEVVFGDLFKEDGFRAIAVNEFFDSELGLPVSEKSLHGILISKCFSGHRQAFDQIVEKELEGVLAENIPRAQGKTRKYPIGATAEIQVNTDRYLCFALCKTDITTCKAYSDIATLWQALQGLWQKARIVLGGTSLILPLVGSALAGIGLPARELLDLIILSAITETKRKEITTCIRIVLTPDRFDSVDLMEVQKYWS